MLGLAGRFEHEAVPCRRRPARGFARDRQYIGRETARAARIHVAPRALNDVIKQYCQDCHNDDIRSGNLSLMQFDASNAPGNGDVAEKMIAKLRAGMMPPPGKPRPGRRHAREHSFTTLETQLDAAAAANPNPGRANLPATESRRIRGARSAICSRLDIDAGDTCRRTRRARTSTTSPTCRRCRRRCSTHTSARRARSAGWRSANPKATPSSATYKVPRTASQLDHVEGAPFGTRGGTSVVHNFPADGQYLFKVLFYHETTGRIRRRQRARRAHRDLGRRRAGGRARHRSIHDGLGSERRLDGDQPVRVRAGPHRVSAAFIPPAYQACVAGPDHAAQVVA